MGIVILVIVLVMVAIGTKLGLSKLRALGRRERSLKRKHDLHYNSLDTNRPLHLDDGLRKIEGEGMPIFDKESDNTKPLNQRMTTLHRLINKNPILYFVADIIKRIIPKMAVDVIRSYIFIRFNRYQPELSSDRIKLVQAHAHTVNENLIRKMTLDLRKYKYE